MAREKWADIIREDCGDDWVEFCLKCQNAPTDPYASDMSMECVTCDPVTKVPHSNFKPRKK